MKTTHKLFLLPLLAASSVAVNAATQTFSDIIVIAENSSLDGTNVITLSQFDSNLGTLTSVTVIAALKVPSLSIVVDNDSEALAEVTTVFGTIGGISYSSSALASDGSNSIDSNDFNITTQNLTFSVEGNDTDSTSSFDVDGGPDNGSFTTTSVNNGDSVAVASFSWGNYEDEFPGSISYEIAVDFVTDMNVNTGGGGGATRYEGTIPSSTFEVALTYTYTPVPEPSSYAALLGLFALGLVCIRRRR